MADQKAPVRCGFQRLQYVVVIGEMQLRLEERIVQVGTPPEGFVRWIGYGQVDESIGKFGAVKGPAPFALPGAETFKDAMGRGRPGTAALSHKPTSGALTALGL